MLIFEKMIRSSILDAFNDNAFRFVGRLASPRLIDPERIDGYLLCLRAASTEVPLSDFLYIIFYSGCISSIYIYNSHFIFSTHINVHLAIQYKS